MKFVFGGHEIDYEVRGEGRPVLLVHGVTGDRRVMEAGFEANLAGGPWQRVYFDLPGHGVSRGAWEESSADAWVDAIVALTRQLELERPLAIGYSYGGYLVQGVARDLALGGALLVCPVIEPDFGKRRVAPRHVLRRDQGLLFGPDEREQIAFDEIAVVQTAAVLADFQRAVHPGNLAADQDVVGAVRYRYSMARHHGSALAERDCPVTVVCGRHDHWVGYEDAFPLARRIPNAEYTVLADCGHLLPFEAPAALREVMSRWLSRCAEAEPGRRPG
jgi:pimeloyl-ACP methyl ester carboxylesterase